MKVIEGARKLPWYVGVQCACRTCGKVVEFDDSDWARSDIAICAQHLIWSCACGAKYRVKNPKENES